MSSAASPRDCRLPLYLRQPGTHRPRQHHHRGVRRMNSNSAVRAVSAKPCPGAWQSESAPPRMDGLVARARSAHRQLTRGACSSAESEANEASCAAGPASRPAEVCPKRSAGPSSLSGSQAPGHGLARANLSNPPANVSSNKKQKSATRRKPTTPTTSATPDGAAHCRTVRRSLPCPTPPLHPPRCCRRTPMAC